jgi:hypothetical protein
MTTLYKNTTTQVVFESADAQTDAAVSEINPADVATLVSQGYTLDASAAEYTPNDTSSVAAPVDSLVATPAPAAATVAPDGTLIPAGDAPVTTTASTDAAAVDATNPAAAPLDATDIPVAPTVTNVTDPASGETTVQTDLDAPVVPQVPVETPAAPVLSIEDQAAAQHAQSVANQQAVADANAAIATSAAAPADGSVVIAPVDHATAKDYFAGLMAKLHSFEAETVEDLKEDMRAIGELLHLHSTASREAEQTGNYTADDAKSE